MNKNPKVSICVPVYNSEKYLGMFLDSALNQNFDSDDYEVILADNCSSDNSYIILKEYERLFPGRVFAYKTDEHGGPGKGRNLAFQKSRGEYIYWCDSDDFIHADALSALYAEAEEYNADLVCGSGMEVIEEDGEIVRVSRTLFKRKDTVDNETAIISEGKFWLSIIRRDLIEKVGAVPDDIIFDDVRYLTVLQSYAKVIRFLDFPVYYWFKRGSSTTSTIRKEMCEDSVEADKYILENSNQEYIDAVQHYVAIRNEFNLRERWQYFDVFVNWIHAQAAWFYDNDSVLDDRKTFDVLRWADSLSDIHFPNIVYVDGFAAAPGEERLAELREKVFHDGCEIVVLSPETCDINENEYVKRAYDRGNMAQVTGYFALKNIYENGGVFIHDNIRILNYFSYLKYQNAFFSLIDKTTYSEWIYGAPADNEAIGAILKTFSDTWDKKGEYMPLSERISIILTAKYGIPLDGKARLWGKIVSVISADLSVADTRFGNTTKKCAFEHDFSALAGEPDYITLPRTSLRVLMTPPPAKSVGVGVGKSARERALEKELADMKATNTYKLMMKIRAIGDGPHGPFLKKIFHWMLRVRKKLLRK